MGINEQTANNKGDDIVISGISGRFPMSPNVKDFEDNLYNKINMVTDDESRWLHTNPAIPKYSGKIGDLSRFDATFFGIHQLQSDNMDPQNRILIEESFKAVMDAGINPNCLRGTNTGVYVGSCFSESENHLYYHLRVPSGFGITGSSKAMFANRISYGMGLIGPSFFVDTACSSSLYALDLAFQALDRGEVDAAIVGGANLCLHPTVQLLYEGIGVLSPDGKCCSFDSNSNGYVRSESISCIFLQRRSQARRVYGTIVSTLTNCDGFKIEGINHCPSSVMQERLLKQIYQKAKVDIDDLGYLEAHGLGTVTGDTEECRAIDGAICSKRRDSLLIGSVKSNCGHTEAASGLCSVMKVIFAMENNTIPPNINFTTARSEIAALRDGRLKVVAEPTKLPKPYVGINSYGYGGTNAHVIVKQCEKEKVVKQLTGDAMQRLVTWASRTEEGVISFFADLERKPYDEEYLALVQSAQSGGIQGMVFRGYAILEPVAPAAIPKLVSKTVEHNSGVTRPLVWVFSGMGSQWAGMGKSLMQLPLFNESIQRCHHILKPHGLDLINIITCEDRAIFENILHSFVGIAAIQIALVNILRELGLSPEFIIGHSVGELGCAYADNCFTEEQMILAAYYRGKVSLEQSKIKGAMAAVGLGFTNMKPLLPESIEIACHNSADSCTISGPADDIAKFVEHLQSKNIFARQVPCSNIPYHSRYIAHFGPALLKLLKKIIPKPIERSSKWISSSVPKGKWMQVESKYSSAEYHTNNLLSNVLFEEACTFIPKNALTIEVAPHSLLQSILKGSIGEGVHIGLTKRNSADNTKFFLDALGSLYVNGLELNIDKLYPVCRWPVSRGTPSLSHLIDFEHTQEYFVYEYKDSVAESGIQTYKVKLSGNYEYLLGHEVNGQVIVPVSFYLECVWRTFATIKAIPQFENLSVEFENVKFLRSLTLAVEDTTEIVVVIQKGSGKFEIAASGNLLATGFVRDIIGKTKPSPMFSDVYQESVPLKQKDFYKELKLRGYHYDGDFQGVEMSLSDGSYGKVKWTRNWVTFIDCMLQVSIVGNDSRNPKLPTKFRTLRIYPQYHQTVLEPEDLAEVFSNNQQKKIISGGIEIVGLNVKAIQWKKATDEPVLESYEFVSHFPAPRLSQKDIARCCVQLVIENEPKSLLNILDLSSTSPSNEFLNSLKHAISDLPLVTGNYFIFQKSRKDKMEYVEVPNVSLLYRDDDIASVCGNIAVVNESELVADIITPVVKNMDARSFLIVRAQRDLNIKDYRPPIGFSAIAFFPAESETFILLQKTQISPASNVVKVCQISSNDLSFQWLKKLQEISKVSNNIILVSYNEQINGMLGLVNCLRKEANTSSIRCFIINDTQAPAFEIGSTFYKNQLKLGLAFNVYQKGSWGTYRHLLLPQALPPTARSDHVIGNIQNIGDLASLKWLQGPLTKDNFTIKIAYSSLNPQDISLASGRLTVEAVTENRLDRACTLGIEFSGIDLQSGKNVMGMVNKAALSSHIGSAIEDNILAWEVPSQWSLEQAATVPVVYLTVYYAFFYTADIRNGRSILIHSGNGDIGIAAIRVALAYDLEVYTTVNSLENKSLLLQTFPDLRESNIGNSTDTSFEKMIIEGTHGQGVDFVLNSLAEDKLMASVRCLGRRGHFLQIDKFGMANDNPLSLGAFLKELSFHAVLPENLLNGDKKFIEAVKQHISKDIENGIVTPLPSTVFAAHELEKAFRYLLSGQNIGKVLLRLREAAESDVTLPISVHPHIYFKPELVYVVPGGLGGIGLELVDWMVVRGARKIVLSSSRGISNDYQKFRTELWKKYGCKIVINTSDIATENGCLELLSEALKFGPIGGIFNLAAVLKDALFTNQTAELFQQSFQPKVLATQYLNQMSRKLCPKLQHFVIFSSVTASGGRGKVCGQTNYAMANSIMERIIEDRVAHGLPGKAVQWGPVGDVGLVAETSAPKIDLEVDGMLKQRITSCLDVLDTLLSTSVPIVASMVVAEKQANNALQSPIDFILNILCITDIKSISYSATLFEIGMDNFKVVEIQKGLVSVYGISLNQAELKTLTVAKLVELSANYLKTPTNNLKRKSS